MIRGKPKAPRILIIPILVGLLHGVAGASEGRIPIATSTTIDQPGHYVVVRDIQSSNPNVIVIDSSNVTLDLGGHTVTQTGSTGRPLFIGFDVTDVTVRNGRLEGGATGVGRLYSGSRATLRLEDLEIDGVADFGIKLVELEYIEVLRCRVAGNLAASGIILNGGTDAFGGRIIGNVVENTQGFGIALQGLKGGEVRDNHVYNAGGDGSTEGLLLWSNLGSVAGGNRVSGNTIRGSGHHGITVADDVPCNLIIGNTVTDSAADGFQIISDGNQVVGNIASGNGGSGFRFSLSYNLIRNNHAVGNGGDGLYVTSFHNLIEDNTSEANTGYGLYFVNAASNAYRDNMLRGNTAGAVGGLPNTDAGGNVQ